MATVEERVNAVTARVLRLDPERDQAGAQLHRATWAPRASSRSSWWPCSRRSSASRWTRTPPCRCTTVGERGRVHRQGLQGAGRGSVSTEISGRRARDIAKREIIDEGASMSKTIASHPLVDATEPNLLEDIVRLRPAAADPLRRARSSSTSTASRWSSIPQALKTRDIVITDTTFRDGQQARPPYTVDQMVHIYDLLAQAGRAQRRHPPDRVLPLHQERPRDARPLPRAGPPLSRVHRLDPRRQGRLPPGPGGRAEGDRHAHQLLRLPHLPQAQVQEPPGVHGPLLRGGRRRVRGGRPAALPPGGRHPGRHRRLRPALRRAADAR